jgi:hypothetical protein
MRSCSGALSGTLIGAPHSLEAIVAKLVHEVWEETVDGMLLHCCCLAGPMGDGCRSTLSPDARLVQTFEASSHFEAMTFYNALLGRERYTTDQPWDYEPYPAGWPQWQQEQQH